MTSSHYKRIAKNTLMLYSRQILTLGIGLYTVRVTLDVLGVTDYGIYNVIAGIVSLFAFLSGSMASATQRFFSFALGEEDTDRLNKTFTSTGVIYVAIALVALILLETVGLWFVNNHLKIPPESVQAVRWVYQFSVLTFIVSIISTPFVAMTIAHEDMHIYAWVSIAESLMRLMVVLMLVHLPWGKLELYAFLLLAVAVVRTVIYIVICTRKYSECQYRKLYWDKKLVREMFGFTGWTLFGQITCVGRNQMITILLNQFFNPTVVAARAISNSISGQMNAFSGNFNKGLYPPIIKSYAAGDRRSMFSLITNGSKITFFLMWIFSFPLFLHMDFVLHLWLVNVPDGAVLFARLALMEVLINSISLPLYTAARAPGRMRLYELTLGSIQILIFVAAWIVLKAGGEAYSVYVIAIVANLIMFIVRLLIVRFLIGLPLKLYFRQTLLPVCLIIALSSLPSIALHLWFLPHLVFDLISILSSVVLSTVCMYFIGLNRSWRAKVRAMVKNKVNKTFGTSFA